MPDFFAHMRLVHNAQTLISLIAFYFIWSGWSPATELYAELAAFRDMVAKARQAVERPRNLDDLIPDVPDHKLVLRRQLLASLGIPLVNIEDSHSLPIELLTSFPEESSVSLSNLWQDLQSQRWRVPERFTVPTDILDEMKDWIDEWRVCETAVLQYLVAIPGPLQVAPDSYTRPTVRVEVIELRQPLDAVLVGLEVSVYSPSSGVPRHSCRGDSRADSYERDRLTRLTRESKSFGPLHLVLDSARVSVPPSFFDRYPWLRANLAVIGQKTLSEALAWAAGQQRAAVGDRDFRLLGARFTGRDLGLIVPLALVAAHIYMLVMLLTFGSRGLGVSDELIPWLAASPSPPAVVWSLATLVALPAVASGLAVWRLTVVSSGIALALATFHLALGVATYAAARRSG